MSTASPDTIIMSAPSTPIIEITLSIYEASTVTFVNDTYAYTTVDINQSKLTKIDSWCKQYPFIVDSVTQSFSTF